MGPTQVDPVEHARSVVYEYLRNNMRQNDAGSIAPPPGRIDDRWQRAFQDGWDGSRPWLPQNVALLIVCVVLALTALGVWTAVQ